MIIFLKRNIIILSALLILVIYLQYLLLQPVLSLGFSHEDWFMLDYFRALGSDPLFKIPYVLKTLGPHYIQEYWVGMLVNMFGLHNLLSLREFNISLKVIETLMVYPVVLLIFKRKLLAFLSTLIYAIHYSTTGALEDIISGPDYLVGLFLLFFLAIYYHLIKNGILNLKWLSLLFLSFTATIFFQPVRAFPIFIFPFLIEIILFFYDHSKFSLRNSFFRLLTLSPVYILILIFVVSREAFQGFGSSVGAPRILTYLSRGDWYFVLHPISSLSNLFLPFDFLPKVFGTMVFNPDNLLSDYLLFVIRKTFIIFGPLTYLFSFFIKPASFKRWKFILVILVFNFILDIIAFFIYNQRYNTFPNYQDPGEITTMSSVIFGIFILVLNFWAIFGWWKGGRKNNLLWAFWSGLSFSFIFLFLTNLMAEEIFAAKTIHRYLLTASLGASLGFAGILILFYDKIASPISNFSRIFTGFLIFLVLVAFYKMSSQQISNFFSELSDNGRSIQAQDMMHQKFSEKFSKYSYDNKKPLFFFFDATEEPDRNKLLFEDSFSSNFIYWIHLESPELMNGCMQNYVGTVDSLKEFVKVENGRKGIDYKAYCINPKDGTHNDIVQTFFTPENFYSFKVKNLEFIDNRDEALKELGLDY